MSGKLLRTFTLALICAPLAGHAQAPRMPDDADPASDGLTDIPSLPALEVTVWAVQYRDLPPVMVNLSQRDGAWRARAEFRDSRLRAEYRRSSGRWRVEVRTAKEQIIGVLRFHVTER